MRSFSLLTSLASTFAFKEIVTLPVALFHQIEHPAALQASSQSWSSILHANVRLLESVLQKACRAAHPPRLVVLPEDGLWPYAFTQTATNVERDIVPFCVASELLDARLSHSVKNRSFVKTKNVGARVLDMLGTAAEKSRMFFVTTIYEAERKEGGKGHRVFNTAVAFDQEGRLVARYRKRHLYGTENEFVTGGEIGSNGRRKTEKHLMEDLRKGVFEVGVEGTIPPLRVGLLVCADLMFDHPLRSYRDALQVSHFAAPSLWHDRSTPSLPQFQAAAWRHNVYILAPNFVKSSSGKNLDRGESAVVGPKGCVLGSTRAPLAQLVLTNVPLDARSKFANTQSRNILTLSPTQNWPAWSLLPKKMHQSRQWGASRSRYESPNEENKASRVEASIVRRSSSFVAVRLRATLRMKGTRRRLVCEVELDFLNKLNSDPNVENLILAAVKAESEVIVHAGWVDGVRVEECGWQAWRREGFRQKRGMHWKFANAKIVLKEEKQYLTFSNGVLRDGQDPRNLKRRSRNTEIHVLPLLEAADWGDPFEGGDFEVEEKKNLAQISVRNEDFRLRKAILRKIL